MNTSNLSLDQHNIFVKQLERSDEELVQKFDLIATKSMLKAPVIEDEQRAAQLITGSNLFDFEYYTAKYPDVESTGLDPLQHYIRFGANKGYNPNLLFDTVYYLKQNPDVARLGINPLEHYILTERRDPHCLFDTTYYLNQYPDVALVGMNPLEHYIHHGAFEGRSAFSLDKIKTVIRTLSTNPQTARYLKCLGEDKLTVSNRKQRIKIGIYSNSLGNYFISEIADFMAEAFERVGANPIRLTERDRRPTDLDHDLIIAPHEFFYLGKGQSLKTDPYMASAAMVCLEQPHTSWFSKALYFLRKAKVIFDPSIASSAFLDKLGLPTYFLPIGYLQDFKCFESVQQLPDLLALESLPVSIRNTLPEIDAPLADRPIDLFYISTATGRREQFLARSAAWLSRFHCFLHIPSVNEPLLQGTDQALDTQAVVGLSRRSKILLNVHRGELPYFEWHRTIFHGLWQKTLVVTEPCHQIPGLIPGEHFVECKLEDMEMKIDWLLNTVSGKAEAERIRQAGHLAIKQFFDMDRVMNRVLDLLNQSSHQ